MEFHSAEEAIIWFRDRYQAGELELKPPFQRKPVWAAKQKCWLIESILLNLPVPEVYLQHTVRAVDGNERSMFYVVDGQQRIRTVLQFLGADLTPEEAEWNKFSLDKLDPDSAFKGKTYSELSSGQRQSFLRYNIAVRKLDVASDDAVRDIFKRLNKYLTKLNDQELRNATFTGPFMQLSLRLAEDRFWAETGLVTPTNIRRMKDVEFVSELLIGVSHGPQGGSARTIDEYYTQYEDYDDEFPRQRIVERRFGETLSLLKDVLPAEDVSRFRHNRTDFYTIFVAVAHTLRTAELPKTQYGALKRALRAFEIEVDTRLGDETKKTSKSVIEYVRAAEKGVNDKKRRADRNGVVINLIAPFFKSRKKT